jgi:hypothetical protein
VSSVYNEIAIPKGLTETAQFRRSHASLLDSLTHSSPDGACIGLLSGRDPELNGSIRPLKSTVLDLDHPARAIGNGDGRSRFSLPFEHPAAPNLTGHGCRGQRKKRPSQRFLIALFLGCYFGEMANPACTNCAGKFK